MSDVRCVVCGEPWDYWGARHGDMKQWEWELFRKGAGCPACEGEPNGYEPETLSDVEFGDLDPGERIAAREDHEAKRAPEWKASEPEVVWTCSGCGVQVVRDPDELYTDGSSTTGDALCYHVPRGARAAQWYNSHPFTYRGEPTEEPAHTFEGGETVCEFCLDHCDHCGREVCGTLEGGDCYSDDQAFTLPEHQNGMRCTYHCIDCVEHQCETCGQIGEDCTCEDCPCCGERFDGAYQNHCKHCVECWDCEKLYDTRGHDHCPHCPELDNDD